MVVLNKIYTRTGDAGETALGNGSRVAKHSARVSAYGTVDEVNATVEYLDRLVAENDLPPKMLIVHQFQDQMIRAKQTIRGTDNVQIVIHMDGFGPLRLKRETYARITSDLPTGAVVGWKNFYDEDEPTPTPQETMENDPVPMFVSFQ